jgi:hypothetical protein
MTSARALLGVLLLVSVFSVTESVAYADGESCSSGSDGYTVHTTCVRSGSETSEYIAGHSDHTYSIRPACEVGGTASCAAPATCNIEGHDGFLYNVYQDDDPDPLGWQACLTKQEAKHLGGVTPAMVEHAFRRLAWPASELVVQPPNGKTLVNLDTNFYTTNTAPTTQTVTLLGRPVTIEATPTQYTWHFGGVGEGTAGDLSTTDPGAAYPDLRVTHRYTRTGAVQPSVDTTYAGRYRVGNGGWRNIPANLTVPGVRVDLQVVSATPHLVGY